jgi:hypothetical protein
VISFVDPRAGTAVPVEPYEVRVDWSGPPTVGLLANGFPDSDAFLDEVGTVLAERVPGLTVRSWNKGGPSSPAGDQLLDGIAAEVGMVVTAYGH